MRLLGYPTGPRSIRSVTIEHVREENRRVKTLYFKDELCSRARPGQFVMAWIPGVDEIPLSLSSINLNGLSSVTVAEVGEATKALNMKCTGDIVGVRGPFGNSFEVTDGRTLLVAGGIGIAPLMPLTRALLKHGAEVSLLFGVKTREDLIFLEELEELSTEGLIKLTITTEDGSYGLRGLVTDAAEKVLAEEDFDMVYSCGPERMMHKIYKLTEDHGLPLQVSLERIMRCAMGICGSCAIGEYRVCMDGPIFRTEQLRAIPDFGRFKRGFNGERVPI